MLTYYMENRKNMPIYEYLYRCIRSDILSKKLLPREKLPSKRELAKHLNISVTSVENAYSQLMLEGYIHGEAGRGFFVNEIPPMLHTEKEEPVRKEKEPGEKREKNPAEKEAQEPASEESYIMDFKANRSSVSLFPFATWAKLMRNALLEHNTAALETIPFNGLYELRSALAEHLYHFRGMEVDPGQIIIGAGTEYLYGRLLQVFGESSVIAIEDPGYKKFSQISSSQGVLWDYIRMDDEGMRIDELRKSPANVIHVSPANQFPTGTVMSISRRMELLQWAAEERERFIIEDDYDSELRYVGKPIPTLFDIDERDKVVYMNTFSKSMVPSIRISYMILPPYLLDRYKDTLSFYSCTVSAFEQLTLADFISKGYFERHINRMKQIYKAKRDLFLSALEKSPLKKICKIREADAGTHFLMQVNTSLTDKEIRRRAKENRIHVALLSDYAHYQGIHVMGTIVINYAGLEGDQASQFVKIFEKIFETDIKNHES